MTRRSMGMPLALVALAGALALGACESRDEGPPASGMPSATRSSASPSASVTASPSPSASSTVPAAAREKSEKGAEAFVRFFFDELNRAWTTPAIGVVSALSDGGCQFCTKSEADARSLVDRGQRYSSKPVEVIRATAMTGAAPEGQIFLRTELRQNRSDVVDASGSVISTDAQKLVTLVSGVIWANGAWRMYEVEAQ